VKLLLFGATPSTTGGQVLRQALEAGHDVTVIARTPHTIPHSPASRG
jgi:uncharacterized protein YbjT (DUF2867 family)